MFAERLVSCRPYYFDDLTEATYYQLPPHAIGSSPCRAGPVAKTPLFGRLLLEFRKLHRQGRLSTDEAERLQRACMAQEPALHVVATAVSELPHDAKFSFSGDNRDAVFVDLAKGYLSSLT